MLAMVNGVLDLCFGLI